MAKRGGYPGMGGGMNMNNMMKQVQKMQKQMEEQQKALEEAEFSATAGGGAVQVTVSGKKVLTKVTLDPDAVDPDDVEMLEDLIMVAVNDAMKQVDEANSSSMARMTGGMGGFPF
jgi:DNA-binding YbaB/EbfC family protein